MGVACADHLGDRGGYRDAATGDVYPTRAGAADAEASHAAACASAGAVSSSFVCNGTDELYAGELLTQACSSGFQLRQDLCEQQASSYLEVRHGLKESDSRAASRVLLQRSDAAAAGRDLTLHGGKLC